MKRKKTIILLIFFIIAFVVLLGYWILAVYYRHGFSLNTWINGVYCTGKSVEEVNSELLSRMKAPIVIVADNDGIEYEIDLADVGYQEDYLTVLDTYMEKQDPFLWIENITLHHKTQLLPEVSYNKELLKEAFYELAPIKAEVERAADYCLIWDERNGYALYDGLSNRQDVGSLYEQFQKAVDAGEQYFDIRKVECSYDIPLTLDQEKVQKLWVKVQEFQTCDIVYDMGDVMLVLEPGVVSRFLQTRNDVPILDREGKLLLDEEAVSAFIADLAKEYDTYGKARQFTSTRGDVITLEESNYGTTMDQEAEVAFLLEHLLLNEVHTGVRQYHIPSYSREAFARGVDDIGDTYIEIDMTEQKLYYYEDGERLLETEVVTGNTSRKWGTPEGVYYVYNKQKNRTLRGQGYSTFVKYWMPVKGNVGIHDASWRSEFGGTIYQKNGSHGCINTPRDVMSELYEMVEVGTPVILFY